MRRGRSAGDCLPALTRQAESRRVVMLDRKAYAKIHILLKENQIDDEVYRDLLKRNFGVTSSKDLNYRQFIKLLSILKGNFNTNLITKKQKDFLNMLLAKMNIVNKEKYVSEIVSRQIGSIEELTKREAAIVISALLRYTKRHDNKNS